MDLKEAALFDTLCMANNMAILSSIWLKQRPYAMTQL
jgi:hypothetical protein